MRMKRVATPEGRRLTVYLGKREQLNTFDAVRVANSGMRGLAACEFHPRGQTYDIEFRYGPELVPLNAYLRDVADEAAFCELVSAFARFFSDAAAHAVRMGALLFGPAHVYLEQRDGRTEACMTYLPVQGAGGGLPGAIELLRYLGYAAALASDGRRHRVLDEYRQFLNVAELYSTVGLAHLAERLEAECGATAPARTLPAA